MSDERQTDNDDANRPVTLAELRRAIELLRSYTQQATLMVAATAGHDDAMLDQNVKAMNEISAELIDRFGAAIPRG